ncbi:hypothetical protein CFBP8129_00450 [Xanthomonas hortorum pv. gardneri]|uniref:Uncharacterized protein n=1 Tax=Xanthomonas hortorum pv. gardneri TaxID=2754056 RepID=A0A6V7B7D4_9XANT|nr:hypothetical protein CFBP8129_00450 [Xanthomonas hortorum pv. gardneri]CAD0298196.1 hypothetical protein CFBP8129_00450 [Xanthomonas hortorum pv. gardneri]
MRACPVWHVKAAMRTRCSRWLIDARFTPRWVMEDCTPASTQAAQKALYWRR